MLRSILFGIVDLVTLKPGGLGKLNTKIFQALAVYLPMRKLALHPRERTDLKN